MIKKGLESKLKTSLCHVSAYGSAEYSSYSLTEWGYGKVKAMQKDSEKMTSKLLRRLFLLRTLQPGKKTHNSS